VAQIGLIGLGNILLKDEGFGVHFIKYLEKHYLFPAQITLVDGGCAGLGLLNIMRPFDIVFLFDIFQGEGPPGNIRIFDWEAIEALEDGQMASVHQLGLKDALRLARLQGIKPSLKAFAVVPQDISTGIGLSNPLQKALIRVRDLLFEELKLLAIKPKLKKS